MKEPQGLSNYIAAVLKMESSTFCRVLGDASKVASKPINGGGNTNVCSCGYYNNNQKAVMSDIKPQKENVPPSRPSQRPRQRHSDAELDALRRQGLCFKCGDKWSKAHEAICPKKEFQVLTVINGFELELLDAEVEQEERPEEWLHLELKTLSYSAFVGIDAPKTMKLLGRLAGSDVICMVDSGTSHNFLSPTVMQKLHLKLCEAGGLDVLLGNGVIVKGLGVCRDIPIQINNACFISDFMSLELESADVILGVQWLETLGKCEMDWKKQELSFPYQGGRVTLLGDRSLHGPRLSLKSLHSTVSTKLEIPELMFCSAVATASTATCDPAITELLKAWESVFALP